MLSWDGGSDDSMRERRGLRVSVTTDGSHDTESMPLERGFPSSSSVSSCVMARWNLLWRGRVTGTLDVGIRPEETLVNALVY